nr:arylesterase [Alteromonas halophila]
MLFPLPVFSDQAANDASQTSSSSQKLLVLGDSLSAAYGLKANQGWVSLLQKRWQDEQLPIDVVNAAISGDTTDGGLARLPRLLKQHNPTHVLIELGGNDGLQGHPVGKLKQNLMKMITLIEGHGAVPLLQDMQIPTNYGRRYTEMFGESFDDVADKRNITLVPFFLKDIALDPSLMQRDGIHPNAEAQPKIRDYMYRQLTPLLLPQDAMVLPLPEINIAI